LLGIFSLFSFLLTASNVENARMSVLSCPGNVTVSCVNFHGNLSQYGNATYFNPHIGHVSAGHPVVHYNTNNCNIGTITRTWTVVNYYGQTETCTQIITITPVNVQPSIQWPVDVDLVGCNPNTHPNVTGKPTFTYHQCSLLGTSYNDQVFVVSPSCRKIIRKWTILDWCNSSGSHGSGMFVYFQTIKITDNSIPELNCPEQINVQSTNCKNAFVHVPSLEVNSPTCGGEYHITNNSPFSAEKGANISGLYPVGKTKVKYTVTYGCGAKVGCEVIVNVEDKKAPTAICIQSVAVALMPVHVDHDGVPDGGMVELEARRLDFKSEPACGRGPLRFSFSPDPTDTRRIFTCDDLGKNFVRLYVTDSKGNQTFCVVEVNVQNNSANIPNCRRKEDPPVDPGDDVDTIPNTAGLIIGQVTDAFGTPLENATVQLRSLDSITTIVTSVDTIVVLEKDSFYNMSGALLFYFKEVEHLVQNVDTIIGTPQTFTTRTDSSGNYDFDTIPAIGGDYEVSCIELADDTSFVVNRADLEALFAHLLGERVFQSPYQFLAADLNGDKLVNSADFIILMDFVNGNNDAINPNEQTLIVVRDSIHLIQPNSILQSYRTIEAISDLDSSGVNVSFVVVRRGDISSEISSGRSFSDAQAQSLMSEDLSIRAAQITDAGVIVFPNPATQEVTIGFQADNDGPATIRMYEMSGRLYNETKMDVLRGSNAVRIPLNHDQYQGMLIFQILVDGTMYTGKLVKQ